MSSAKRWRVILEDIDGGQRYIMPVSDDVHMRISRACYETTKPEDESRSWEPVEKEQTQWVVFAQGFDVPTYEVIE